LRFRNDNACALGDSFRASRVQLSYVEAHAAEEQVEELVCYEVFHHNLAYVGKRLHERFAYLPALAGSQPEFVVADFEKM